MLTGAAGLWTVAAELGLMFIGSALPTPLYPIYQRQFQFSELVLTLLFAVYVVGASIALLLFGRLSDQIGRRRTMLPAIVITAISTVAFLMPVSLAVLFVGRLLSGLAIGLATGTATAWIAELEPREHRGRATLIAVGANMVGLAIGPVLSGFLARYAPDPLRLVYAIYLGMLLPAALAAAKVQETIRHPVRRAGDLDLWPRLWVPAGLCQQFVAPAATAFAIFALLGFATALVPSVMAHDLRQSSEAVAGLVVAELFLLGAVTTVLCAGLTSRAAMLSGLILLLPTLGLLVLAEAERSMPILIVDSALAGITAALGYRGSLQVVNEIAPAEARAELVSSYLVACYAGISLPVIGIALISHWVTSFVADLVFAVVVAIAAMAAIAVGLRYAKALRGGSRKTLGRSAPLHPNARHPISRLDRWRTSGNE